MDALPSIIQKILPVVPAYAVEFAAYLALAAGLWAKLPARWLTLALPAVALLSYALLPQTHQLWWQLLGLVLIPSLWFAVLPRNRWLDLAFVAVMAVVLLSPGFNALYSAPKADALGKAMWVRTGMIVVLYLGKEAGLNFGFWPTREEWRIGAREFLYLLPVIGLVGMLISYWKLPVNPDWAKNVLSGLGMFIGSLWFVALWEEFFFRGLLQRWLGLPVAAVLFGLAHLPFRGFPNWKFALLAMCAGIFYGRAFRAAGSVRAGMVTHALTNATWVFVMGKV